jgi:hypothetical protein
VRQITLVSFRRQHAAWALPLIVEASADQDPEVAGTAVLAAGVLTDQMWTFWKPDLLDEITPEDRKRLASEGRKNLLDWWEREGRAKYEGTGARP